MNKDKRLRFNKMVRPLVEAFERIKDLNDDYYESYWQYEENVIGNNNIKKTMLREVVLLDKAQDHIRQAIELLKEI